MNAIRQTQLKTNQEKLVSIRGEKYTVGLYRYTPTMSNGNPTTAEFTFESTGFLSPIKQQTHTQQSHMMDLQMGTPLGYNHPMSSSNGTGIGNGNANGNGGSPLKLQIHNDAPMSTSTSTSPSQIPNGSSSTRIIETLHDKVDDLTKTNIQLTLQSQNLLGKLENYQSRSTKLNESLSVLKHEHDNLTSMINRKQRKLNDIENELEKLQQNYEKIHTENDSSSSKYDDFDQVEKNLQSEIENLQTQYDSLLQSQIHYKDHYSMELNSIISQINELKSKRKEQLQNQLNKESNKLQQLHDIINKITSIESGHSMGVDAMTKQTYKNLQQQYTDAIAKLSLNSWVLIYQQSKNSLLHFNNSKYLNQLQVALPQDCRDIMNDPILVDLETHLTKSSPIIKSRNLSPNVGNSSSNNANQSHKRRSFYGAGGTLSASGLGILPGTVKRNGNMTNNGGSSRNLRESSNNISISNK
ncbi:uncharacterized protein NDAI_0A04970 [Naumovozyma dairenensis CBS 421]|uniref:SWI5-dependent HO expression protein 3 n=1 Tax=Naumovozyma dairenensis (strain ATCC 10597 / BCRC 20456 / CBS 421 / NBRC 0211 / NRRL Y-12639) TaxID=1071378 RepID=G0W4B4_NAUDC|nr:hypothetical protein NDAI_0A04970 [Naumovozyma dairenensis CBS 421]CCD22652.1 hypothetical protein NDAI_0A04970 [Naumovozyma dairenensis CBS 421]